jgi:glyoxylase-like metal-dependent hydrolase (beta-lactamase superfamily II)
MATPTPTRLALVCLIAMLVPASLAAQAPAADEEREITAIQGDLYRVRDGQRHTIFLVTPEGIILGDPLSYETATWLKAELAQRFPDSPVRYLIHSHHHFDRAEGAVVFTATAEVVAHRTFKEALSSARSAWPEFFGITDRNGNRMLDGAEIADSPLGAIVRAKDRNSDGRVTPDELYRRVQDPETTFDTRRTIVLGGRTVEVIHAGSTHAPDMTALYFPADRALFVVDPPVPRFSLELDEPRELLRWLEVIGQLDFQVAVTGNNETISPESIGDLRAYVADLIEGVVAGRAGGLSLAEIQSMRFLDKYASTPFSIDRPNDIATVYRTVRVVNMGISIAAVANYARQTAGFCEGFTHCSDVKPVPLGTIGFSLSGLRVGVQAEFTAGDQSWHVQTGPFFDHEFAARQTRGAVLFRYQPSLRPFSTAFVAGVSITKTDIKGMTRQKEASARVGGLRPSSTQLSATGFTAGADVMRRVGRIELGIPVRVTFGFNEDNVLHSRTDIQAGVGLTYGFVRRVN